MLRNPAGNKFLESPPICTSLNVHLERPGRAAIRL